MTRHWLFCRLSGPGWTDPGEDLPRPVPDVVPRLVRRVRLADPGCCWFFQRLGPPTGPAIGLWFDSTPEVLHQVEERLRREAARRGGNLAVEDDRRRPASPPHAGGRDATDELSAVSSDFTLKMLAVGAPGPDEQFALAVVHMRNVVELVPDVDRLSFLFLCWQHWAVGMTPVERVESGVYADLRAGMIPPSGRGTGTADSWQGYLRETRRITMDQHPCEAIPANYLLFDQAHGTHGRLGIPAFMAAQAAQVVRIEQATGSKEGSSPCESTSSSATGPIPFTSERASGISSRRWWPVWGHGGR
jgi:hypothetical protein